MSKSDATNKIYKLAQSFDMMDYIDKLLGKYLRGMKQKISIARSIIHTPSVMLFDEPTTGLDVSASRVVQDFILKCKEENKIILLSSHSMKEVEKLYNRVVIINKGKLFENCSISELKTKYNNNDLEEVFLKFIGGNRDA